jgi:3-isopropylmalate dehydrogenase
MGMAASAEIGDNHCLFQPAHGSAPDIMGQDKANPLAAILSGGLMLDWLGYKSDNEKLITGTRLIDKAIEDGFAASELRPIEFGGDMGLKEMTKVVIDNVHKAEIE